MMNTAVILAAGRGSRLDPGGGVQEFAKPLMQVGGETLLARTVRACRDAGARQIVVVTGFRAELVAAEAARLARGGDVTTAHNPDWHLANGVSLYRCRDVVRGAFALMMCDHVFEPSILADVMASAPPAGSVILAVDRKIDSVFDLDDATKIRVEGDRIVAIGKELGDYNAIDCGLFACTPAIFGALDHARDARGDCSLSDGMRVLARDGRFLPFDIGDRWWQDVDTPDMLDHALQMLAS